jgi:diguanylate cyclase (GGDEF)-like protein
MNTQVLNILLLSLLVLVFGSILRKRSTGQMQFWFIGWLFVLLNYIAHLMSAYFSSSTRVVSSMEISTLELTGVFFVVAVSNVCSDTLRRWILTICISVPALLYTNSIIWGFNSKPLSMLVLLAAFGGVLGVVWAHYRRASAYVLVISGLCLLMGTAMAIFVIRGQYESGLRVVQAALFFVAAGLYFRRFTRATVGVITAVTGLFAWGLAFATDGLSLLSPAFNDISTGSLLELAKYFVAVGMIVTVLEEQIEQATEASQQLVHQAQHDPLTGLPNRLLFEDRLAQALARSRRSKSHMAVFCIDLDRFKQVNDSYGHHTGDLYLKSVTSRFLTRIRESDTLARTGGDEFAVVVENLRDVEDAGKVAQNLLDTLKRPLMLDGNVLQGAASIGVAVYPYDGDEPESLRKAADQAMYRAKSQGRNHCEVFSEEAREMLDLETTLRKALEIGGFHLQYQPQVTCEGHLAGFEALLRFKHPKLGMLPPSRFIPIAEESGLIVPIGDWAFREALRQALEWKKQYGFSHRMAVNVSPLQFTKPDFAETVESILKNSGLPPNQVEMELTETMVMSNVDESSRQMSRLKQLGVHISIDDFGTGYSSLSYLHRLPIDTLKIDRSFVDKMTEPGGTRPIVEAIISLARSLGLQTIAEGVETPEQLELLTQLKCDVIQGFLFSRPLSVENLQSLLELYSREGTARVEYATA